MTELVHMGVIFDNKLCWNKNVSCINYQEGKHKIVLSEETKIFWAQHVFAGHLLQCSSVWCSYLWGWSGGEGIFLNMKGEE